MLNMAFALTTGLPASAMLRIVKEVPKAINGINISQHCRATHEQ